MLFYDSFCIYPCKCYVQFRGKIKLSVSVSDYHNNKQNYLQKGHLGALVKQHTINRHFFLFPRRYPIRRCARCNVGLSSLELVMRSRDFFYHVDCFTCFSCNKILSPGDTYGNYDNQIFCREDYEMLLNNSQLDTGYCHVYNYGYPDVDAPHEMTDCCGNGFETISLQKGRSRKRRHLMAVDGCFQTLGK